MRPKVLNFRFRWRNIQFRGFPASVKSYTLTRIWHIRSVVVTLVCSYSSSAFFFQRVRLWHASTTVSINIWRCKMVGKVSFALPKTKWKAEEAKNGMLMSVERVLVFAKLDEQKISVVWFSAHEDFTAREERALPAPIRVRYLWHIVYEINF